MQENWQSNWFKHFYPVKIGETLIILPSWEKWEEFSVRHPVWIEPGQSFGTGHHISTVLALEILEKFLLGSNKIYSTTYNGFLITSSAIDGKTETYNKIGDSIIADPIISDGSLYILTKNQKLIGFN